MKAWLLERVSDTITEQLGLIGVSLLAGAVLCLVYDMFRGCRRVHALRCQCRDRQAAAALGVQALCEKKPQPESRGVRLWIGLQDLLFWTIYVVITYVVLYEYHNGTIAGYVFLGEALGALLYYRLFHNWMRCLFTCVLWQICTITGWILKWICLPFRVICGNFLKLLKNIAKSVKMVITNN